MAGARSDRALPCSLEQTFSDAGLNLKEIDLIVFAGAPTRMPAVRSTNNCARWLKPARKESAGDSSIGYIFGADCLSNTKVSSF